MLSLFLFFLHISLTPILFRVMKRTIIIAAVTMTTISFISLTQTIYIQFSKHTIERNKGKNLRVSVVLSKPIYLFMTKIKYIFCSYFCCFCFDPLVSFCPTHDTPHIFRCVFLFTCDQLAGDTVMLAFLLDDTNKKQRKRWQELCFSEVFFWGELRKKIHRKHETLHLDKLNVKKRKISFVLCA